MHTEEDHETSEGVRHDDDNQPGAEGGESASAHRAPAAPAGDGTPLGDTDQHSNADA
jgi:hypothetical protein